MRSSARPRRSSFRWRTETVHAVTDLSAWQVDVLGAAQPCRRVGAVGSQHPGRWIAVDSPVQWGGPAAGRYSRPRGDPVGRPQENRPPPSAYLPRRLFSASGAADRGKVRRLVLQGEIYTG